jgi:signal transduction histidine kinase
MNIRVQAYLLIALPLLAATVFMLSLMDRLGKLDRALEMELHARDVMERVNDLNSKLWIFFLDVNLVHASPDVASFQEYAEQLRWFSRRGDELRTLVSNDTHSKDEVNAFLSEIDRGTSFLQKLADLLALPAPSSLVPMEEIVAKMSESTSFLRKTETQLAKIKVLRHAIDQSYSQVVAEFEPKASGERRKLITLVILGVCINIGIAILLAAQFGKRIVNRLDRLMINIQRFAKREANLEEIEGRDEIAAVNKAFREVADARLKSEEFKQLLLSMVSHDLRSPLLSLSGYLSMAIDGSYGEVTPPLKGMFKQAESETVLLSRTVSDLLEIEKLDNKRINLALSKEFVESVVQSAFDETKEFAELFGVKLKSNITPELAVECDRERIVQVLVRFLTNAIKCPPRDSIVSVSAFKTARGARIEIFDGGPAISPDEQLHAFDQAAFADAGGQKKRQIGGVSLYFCKAIVEMHRGVVGISADAARGNCFWLELPDDRSGKVG